LRRANEVISVNVPRLLALGSINVDFQMRLGRQIEEGLTLIASDFSQMSGGKAANNTILAHRLEREASLFGRVGNDDLAEMALAPLRDVGIDLRGVSRAEGKSTAVSTITVPPSGKKTIVANDVWDDKAMQDMQDGLSHAPSGCVLVVDYEVAARSRCEGGCSRERMRLCDCA
jgi:ribokinase